MKKLFVLAMMIFAVTVFSVPMVSAQMEDFGTISGVVTDQDSDEAVYPAVVRAYAVDGPFWPIAWDMTDESGNYELDVPYGGYHVKADAMDFLPEWWQEAIHREDATVVLVDEENSPVGIDFTLTGVSSELGSIAGVVTDFDSGDPIEDAVISLRMIGNHHFHRVVHSLEDGSYLFGDLPVGAFNLECFKEGYLPAEYPDPVEVNGDDITGIDFALEILVFGSISGTVTDAGTGDPIEGARIIARLPGGHHFVRVAESAEDGTYLIDDLPPGDYVLSCCKMGYEWMEYPEPVTVDGDDVTGIDFAMEAFVFGGISGVITDAATGDPIENAVVVAVNGDMWHNYNVARTDENGEYEMVLISGEYRVEVRAWGYLPDELDEPIVIEDEILTGIDFALEAVEFGSISGTVYNADSEPVPNAFIDARQPWGFGHIHTRSDESGNYTLENLFPGTYNVRAFAYDYLPQTYDEPVVVENGMDVTGIDFYLEPFESPFDGIISGTVIDEVTEEPIADALVAAVGLTWNHHQHHLFRRFTHTDENGAYTFENLPTADFKLLSVANGYVAEFYDNKYRWHDAGPVTPDAYDINFALAPQDGGVRLISGQVTEDGLPVAGVFVQVMQDDEVVALGVTYPDGNYYIEGLMPGDYDIKVITPNMSEGTLENVSVLFADEYEADIVFEPTSADDISLPAAAALHQNYPNPFNASTNISFYLADASDVELSVFDLLGRKVSTLVSSRMEAGSHTITWNGTDSNNNAVVSGIYLYVLNAGDQTASNRMLLLK